MKNWMDCNNCVMVCPFNKPPEILHDAVRYFIRHTPALNRFMVWMDRNGGGAFLLIYALAVVLIGVPVMTSEFILGTRGQSLSIERVIQTNRMAAGPDDETVRDQFPDPVLDLSRFDLTEDEVAVARALQEHELAG